LAREEVWPGIYVVGVNELKLRPRRFSITGPPHLKQRLGSTFLPSMLERGGTPNPLSNPT
jgi:hypothetical protein